MCKCVDARVDVTRGASEHVAATHELASASGTCHWQTPPRPHSPHTSQATI